MTITKRVTFIAKDGYEDKMKELKRNTESALKADQKMYGAIRPINKILTELALRISGDK